MKKLKPISMYIAVTIGMLLGGLYLSWALSADTNTRIEFIKTIPIIIIGLIAAGIAFRQYETAKAKLNLDLFEKRYEIFNLTWKELSKAITEEQAAIAVEFTNIVPKSEFLFGTEMREYLQEIITHRIAANMYAKRYDNGLSNEDLDKWHEANMWLGNEATSGAKERFGKFMNFEEWK